MLRVAGRNDPLAVFQQLFDHYGPQQWWPAETPFEVMVGAILTQNTTWSGVEKAITNLKQANALSLEGVLDLPQPELGELIRPSGYFNLKSKRLQNYCIWYREHQQQAWEMETDALRNVLLQINGVGPETADDILLYAFERLQWLQGGESYEEIRSRVESCFSAESTAEQVRIYNELHGLIVSHAKQFCRKKPQCEGCPLEAACGYSSLKSGD